jgi:hypothetical protein
MTEAERIAAGLSPAAKKALTTLKTTMKRAKALGVSEAQCGNLVFEGLAYMGTDKTGWFATYGITPLGRKTRKVLEQS